MDQCIAPLQDYYGGSILWTFDPSYLPYGLLRNLSPVRPKVYLRPRLHLNCTPTAFLNAIVRASNDVF